MYSRPCTSSPANPLEVFAIWKGGLVFYGGLLAACPSASGMCGSTSFRSGRRRTSWRPTSRSDTRFGRLGCFFAGCCYGAPCSGPFCITFSDPHSLAPLGVPLFPTQLMESGGEFLIFGMLLLLAALQEIRRPALLVSIRSSTPSCGSSSNSSAGTRSAGLYFGGLISTSQIIAMVMFAFRCSCSGERWTQGRKRNICQSRSSRIATDVPSTHRRENLNAGIIKEIR